MFTCLIGLYLYEKTASHVNNLCAEFSLNFKNAIETEKNLMILQKFDSKDSIPLQYYDNSKKGKDTAEINFDGNYTPEGLVMTNMGSGGGNADNTKHSFKYDQMSSCYPLPAREARASIEPKALANKYRNDSACMGARLKWDTDTQMSMICSLQEQEDNYAIEKKIMAASIYYECFREGMEYIRKTLNSNNNSLKKLNPAKYDKYTKNKFLEILIDIRDNEYDRLVREGSEYQINYLYLKKNVKEYIIQLLEELQPDVGINEDGTSTSSGSSSSREDVNKGKEDCSGSIICNNNVTKNGTEYDDDIKRTVTYLSTEYGLIPRQKNDDTATKSLEEKSKYESSQPGEETQTVTKEYITYFENYCLETKPDLTQEKKKKCGEFIQKYPTFLEDLKRKNITLTPEMVTHITEGNYEKLWKLIESYTIKDTTIKYYKDEKSDIINGGGSSTTNTNGSTSTTTTSTTGGGSSTSTSTTGGGSSTSTSTSTSTTTTTTTTTTEESTDWDEDVITGPPPIITPPGDEIQVIVQKKIEEIPYIPDEETSSENNSESIIVIPVDSVKNVQPTTDIVTINKEPEQCSSIKKLGIDVPNPPNPPFEDKTPPPNPPSNEKCQGPNCGNPPPENKPPTQENPPDTDYVPPEYLVIYSTASRFEGNVSPPEVSASHQKYVLSLIDSTTFIRKLYMVNLATNTDELALKFYNDNINAVKNLEEKAKNGGNEVNKVAPSVS